MKKINFINPIPLSEQYEVRAWIILTLLLLLVMLGTIASISYQQWQTFTVLSAEKTQLNQMLAKTATEQAAAKKMYQEFIVLQKRHNTLNNRSQKIDQSIQHLTTIQSICCKSPTVNLEALHINKTNLTITVACTNSQCAFAATHALNQTKLFNDMHIKTLTSEQKQNKKEQHTLFMCTIQGKPCNIQPNHQNEKITS